MLATGGDDAITRFALGFLALVCGALAVQYSKRLEIGTRQQPREESNPYFELVRFVGALLFVCGLVLIAWSAWTLLSESIAAGF